jgi:hypothetical protein
VYRHKSAWLRVIDEELVGCSVGCVNINDTYEDAKNKLNQLISWHIDVALDPKVNGGFKLVPCDDGRCGSGDTGYGLPY